MKKIMISIFLLASMLAFTSCSSNQSEPEIIPVMTSDGIYLEVPRYEDCQQRCNPGDKIQITCFNYSEGRSSEIWRVAKKPEVFYSTDESAFFQYATVLPKE